MKLYKKIYLLYAFSFCLQFLPMSSNFVFANADMDNKIIEANSSVNDAANRFKAFSQNATSEFEQEKADLDKKINDSSNNSVKAKNDIDKRYNIMKNKFYNVGLIDSGTKSLPASSASGSLNLNNNDIEQQFKKVMNDSSDTNADNSDISKASNENSKKNGSLDLDNNNISNENNNIAMPDNINISNKNNNSNSFVLTEKSFIKFVIIVIILFIVMSILYLNGKKKK